MDKIFHIACIIGTRPEVIKMAMLIIALKKDPRCKVTVINTAQHRNLLDDMLMLFGIQPDVDLNSMQENQQLSLLLASLLQKLDPLFMATPYDIVIAQGDTITTVATALAAFYRKIPFMHVEAGLRTYDLAHPFPEEGNRVLISKIATLHGTPSHIETQILIKENIPAHHIITCGNPVIDTLLAISQRHTPLPIDIKNKRLLLVTLHRRESFGKKIKQIFSALIALAQQFEDIEIVYPVHPNPHVNQTAKQMLTGIPRIRLLDPQPYDKFVALMKHSYLILTDSGGIQEEAPALNKPVLVLRDTTERSLIISQGLGLLLGTDTNTIIQKTTELLQNPALYQSMQKNESPYGDGHASEKIISFVFSFLTSNTLCNRAAYRES